MNNINKDQKRMSAFEVAAVSWRAQILATVLFGIPLLTVTNLYAGADVESIKGIGFLYGLFFIGYLPFYGLIPNLFLKDVKKLIKKINHKEKISDEEMFSTVKKILNLPTIFAIIVCFLSLSAFIVGTIITSIILPLTISANIIIFGGISLGAVVSMIHALLIYIFFENYLRNILEFLISSKPYFKKDQVNIKKRTLFNKILTIIALSTVTAQLSIIIAFLIFVLLYNPQSLKPVLFYIGTILIFTVIFIFIIAFKSTENIIYPIKRIIQWAEEIRSGKVGKKINIVTNDELNDVINYSQEMVQKLEEMKNSLEIRVEARTKELKDLTNNLDEVVKERTKELQKNIEELERFKKLVVGRELKMIELKKELEKN